jgi:hypothetical protein
MFAFAAWPLQFWRFDHHRRGRRWFEAKFPGGTAYGAFTGLPQDVRPTLERAAVALSGDAADELRLSDALRVSAARHHDDAGEDVRGQETRLLHRSLRVHLREDPQRYLGYGVLRIYDGLISPVRQERLLRADGKTLIASLARRSHVDDDDLAA